jgi:hypothetical protein
MNKQGYHRKKKCQVRLDLQCFWKVNQPGDSNFEVSWEAELHFL